MVKTNISPFLCKNGKSIHFLMALVFLTMVFSNFIRPSFVVVLKVTTADIVEKLLEKKPSLSLIDFFIFIQFLLIGIKIIKERFLLSILIKDKQLRDMIVVGSIFVFLCLLSGVETFVFFKDNFERNLKLLLISTAQYAFIFVGLPILAFFYLSANNLRICIRYIALGFITPMVFTVIICMFSDLPAIPYSPFVECIVFLKNILFHKGGRAVGTYGNPNVFAYALTVTFSFYVYLLATEKGFWRSIGCIGCVSSLACLLLTACFGGVISLVMLVFFNMLLMMFWKNNPMRKNIRAIAFNLALVALLFLCSLIVISYCSGTTPEKIAKLEKTTLIENLTERAEATQQLETTILAKMVVRILSRSSAYASASVRMKLNYMALKLIKERNGGLFYGHGLRQTQLIPIFNINGICYFIHNTYLNFWIEGGLVLSLAFICYIGLLFRNCIKLSKKHPNEALAIGSSVLVAVFFHFSGANLEYRFLWMLFLPAFVTIKNTALLKSN